MDGTYKLLAVKEESRETMRGLQQNKKIIRITVKVLLCILLCMSLLWSYSFRSKREILVTAMLLFVFAGLMCYTIFNYEKMYSAYKDNKDLNGFLYAIYFAVMTAFMGNPLRESVTKLTEFKRTMGRGLLDGTDVIRRVNNFTRWFSLLALFLWIYFLLFHYIKKNVSESNHKKILKFTDNIVVLGIVCLLFRAVNLFSTNETIISWMEYSDYIVLAILVFSGVYILFRMDEKIVFSQYQAILIGCWLLMVPIVVVIIDPRCSVLSLICVQYIVSAGVVLVIKVLKGTERINRFAQQISIVTIAAAAIPF